MNRLPLGACRERVISPLATLELLGFPISLGRLGALVRSQINGLLPFNTKIEQTTPMSIAPKLQAY